MRAASTRSPGERVLVRPASQPPVPEPGKMNTCPASVLKTFFRSSNSGSVNLGKSGARMSSIGTFMARWTSSGTLVGPGMNNAVW